MDYSKGVEFNSPRVNDLHRSDIAYGINLIFGVKMSMHLKHVCSHYEFVISQHVDNY